MHCSNEYPLFAPPDSLAKKDRWEWSHAEAKLYFEWLLDQCDSRVCKMLKRLGLTLRDDPEILLATGQKAVDLLKQRAFSFCEKGEKRLTNSGYALCADMGLLIARFLLKVECISWQIERRHKRDFFYNMPVLSGFEHGLSVDPIHISIIQGLSVLEGRKSSRAWYEAYEIWHNKIPE